MNSYILGFLVLVWTAFSAYAAVSVFITKPLPGREHRFGTIVWWYGLAVIALATLTGLLLSFHAIGSILKIVFDLKE